MASLLHAERAHARTGQASFAPCSVQTTHRSMPGLEGEGVDFNVVGLTDGSGVGLQQGVATETELRN